MSPMAWAAFAASMTATVTALLAALRFIVKAYLRELVPNSGSSLADRVMRIETRLMDLHELVIAKTTIISTEGSRNGTEKKKKGRDSARKKVKRKRVL